MRELQPEREDRVRCSAWLGRMVWVITINLKADNFLLLCIHVKLATFMPENAALGKPLLKLEQLRRWQCDELQVIDIAVRPRNCIRENGAVPAPRILGLMNEAAAMPQLPTEQNGDSLQNGLPLGIANSRRETFLGDVCIEDCRIDNHGA